MAVVNRKDNLADRFRELERRLRVLERVPSPYSTVQDEGTTLAQRTILDFTGTGVTAADDPANKRTLVTIPGGDTAWTAPTLLNSWANFGSVFNPAGYRKDSNGFVHLRGLIKNGTTTAGTPIFALPAGYRPAFTNIFSTVSNDLFGEVRVGGAGDSTGYNLYCSGPVSNVWLSLDGLSYLAEA